MNGLVVEERKETGTQTDKEYDHVENIESLKMEVERLREKINLERKLAEAMKDKDKHMYELQEANKRIVKLENQLKEPQTKKKKSKVRRWFGKFIVFVSGLRACYCCYEVVDGVSQCFLETLKAKFTSSVLLSKKNSLTYYKPLNHQLMLAAG